MEIIEDAAGVRSREIIPRVVPVASPGAGAEWTQRIPGGSLWYVQSIRATLTTSVTVANRAPVITISDGSAVFAQAPGGDVQAASLTWQYAWMRNFRDHFRLALTTTPVSGFPAMPLVGGFILASATTAIDATDQWSNIVIYVLEVEETPYDVELARRNAALRGITSNAYPQIRIGDS